MAQLKDTLIQGSARVTDALYANSMNGLTLTAATTGFTIAGGTTSKTLTVNETYTLGAACEKGVTDNSSATAVTSSDTNLITGRTLYYAGYLSTSGGTINGNLTLAATSSGDSPSLIFDRTGSNSTDWKLVVTSGKLSFQSRTGTNAFTERGYFGDNSSNFYAGQLRLTTSSSTATSANTIEISDNSSTPVAMAKIGISTVGACMIVAKRVLTLVGSSNDGSTTPETNYVTTKGLQVWQDCTRPAADANYSLGSFSYRFQTVYAKELAVGPPTNSGAANVTGGINYYKDASTIYGHIGQATPSSATGSALAMYSTGTIGLRPKATITDNAFSATTGITIDETAITPAQTKTVDLGSTDYRFQRLYITSVIESQAYASGTQARYPYDLVMKNSSGNTVAEMYFDAGSGTNYTSGRYWFRQYSPNTTANTTTTEKYEAYALPTATKGLTDDVSYHILTSKNAVTIAQGGTGTSTAPTAGGVIYASSTSAYASTGAGTAGQCLVSGAASGPSWEDKVIWKATCDTAGATADKVATCTNFPSTLTTGLVVLITFANANSAAVADLTLKVGNSTKKNLRCFRNGAVNTLPGAGYLGAQTHLFWYDGTQWVTVVDYNSNTNTYVTQNHSTSNNSYRMLMTSSSGTGTGNPGATTAICSSKMYGNPSTGHFYATAVHNAVWNDYAEYRQSRDFEPGRCVQENDDGWLTRTQERLVPGASIISDTWGHVMGETEYAKIPIAVAGRVLAYPYRNRKAYHAGMTVCCAPNGTVDFMTRDEIMKYPDCIVGIVSEVPEYEFWGSGQVPINGRIWIKVK